MGETGQVTPAPTSSLSVGGRFKEPVRLVEGSADAVSDSTDTTGRDLEQWEYEVTSGGRVRYVISDDNLVVSRERPTSPTLSVLTLTGLPHGSRLQTPPAYEPIHS